jgi:hypothetical protein
MEKGVVNDCQIVFLAILDKPAISATSSKGSYYKTLVSAVIAASTMSGFDVYKARFIPKRGVVVFQKARYLIYSPARNNVISTAQLQ